MSARLTALVTGANSGIGKTIVSRLASARYNVAVNYKVDRAAAENLAKELQRSGARAVAVYGDVANPKEVEAMFENIFSAFGRINAMVNNAIIQVFHTLPHTEPSDCALSNTTHHLPSLTHPPPLSTL